MRILIRLMAATMVLVGLMASVPAQAAGTVKVAALRFPTGAAEVARVGADVHLSGKVRSLTPDLVDFYGRSVITLDDAAALDPDSGDFAVSVKLRLTRGAGDWNLVQKGYWSDPGQWKLSLDSTPDGLRFSCRYKGDRGAVMAYTPTRVVRTDGPWVSVVCARHGDLVTVRVNGVVVAEASGAIGRVANSRDVLIGSKGLTATDRDQFLGQLDALWIRS